MQGQGIDGAIAWVTGGGTGIGEASALALAGAGATVVLTGRRVEPLQAVAGKIIAAGGKAEVEAADLTESDACTRIAQAIQTRHGRIDILVNSAGANIRDRNWTRLTAEGIDRLIDVNLKSALYLSTAVLSAMRAQQDGLIIHIASIAGRTIGLLTGPGYIAAKHGLVALSHSMNMEECVNGIRCSVICPGEVATPILDERPVPVSAEERAKMLQPEDVGDIVLYVAGLPKHVCMSEVQVTPTWNRGYVAALAQGGVST